MKTLCDILTRLRETPRKPDLLRYRTEGGWKEISSEEFTATVRSLALGLAGLGVARGDRVALLSENRPEWIAFDHALLNLGAVVVPLYPTLPAGQARFILSHSESRVLILSTPAQLGKILPILPSLTGLKQVVVMDPPGTFPPGVLSWGDLLREGERVHREAPTRFESLRSLVGGGDLASILYTSGTTGEPKGVMLTHRNLASNVEATLAAIPFNASDSALSFLPLSHAFERLVEFAYLAAGASITYAESLEAVPRNLQEAQPTVVVSVPRLLEKMHAKVMEAVRAAPAHRRILFVASLAVGRKCARARIEKRPAPPVARLLHPLAERLVLGRIRRRLFGERIRFLVTGSAPLSEKISWFFIALGIPVLEGYGLTEASPVVSVNTLERARVGTVGPVIPGVEVRIAADGEILVRGENVMKGYFRNEEETRAAIRNGWLVTGDIGRLDEEGFLRITDRKKEILKTSGGKMIAPQPIENLLKAHPAIAQAVLIGDRRKFVSALLVPDGDWITAFARRHDIPFRDLPDLLKAPRILDLYRRAVESRMEELPPHERVKRFRLLPGELTLEGGELTPTLKPRRSVIASKYAELIESMYRDSDLPRSDPDGGNFT